MTKVETNNDDNINSHKVVNNKAHSFELSDDASKNSFVKQVLEEVDTAVKGNAAEENAKQAEARLNNDVRVSGKDDSSNAGNSDKDADAGNEKQQPAAASLTNMQAEAKPELKFGAAQVQQADGDIPPQEASGVRTQIISQVKTMVGEQKSEFVLQLKPHHLGGLSIMLAADEKGIVAKLVTASKDAHNLIQSEMTSMQEMLRAKVINVVLMEVIYDQMANSTGRESFNEQGHGWEHTHHGSHGRRPEIVDLESAMLTYDDLSTYDILAEQGGSVEFSA